MTYKRILASAAAVVVLLTVGTGAFFYLRKPEPVRVATASLAPVAEIVYATGTVEPIEWAKVVPLQRRKIVELCRCEGQSVAKGQVLGRQDDAEEQALLSELEVREKQLVRDRDRAEKDKAPKAEREQRETAVKEMSSRITAHRSRMETLVLRSPMAGVVLRRDGEVGEIAGPADVLFWVGKPSPLQVLAEVNEEEITKIKVGQKAFLTSEAFEGQSLRASVSHITPKADPVKKTFRVYLLLPPNSPLRTGMTVEANIVFREKPNAVVVPLDAVLGGTVQVVRDGRVRKVPVKTGVRGTQFVEVIGNVPAGASVLSPNRINLADAARVKIASTVKTVAAPNQDNAAPEDTGMSEDASIDTAISASLYARFQSLVSDARRNASRLPRNP
jgi:RND family efflux transporter MFP subunit